MSSISPALERRSLLSGALMAGGQSTLSAEGSLECCGHFLLSGPPRPGVSGGTSPRGEAMIMGEGADEFGALALILATRHPAKRPPSLLPRRLGVVSRVLSACAVGWRCTAHEFGPLATELASRETEQIARESYLIDRAADPRSQPQHDQRTLRLQLTLRLRFLGQLTVCLSCACTSIDACSKHAHTCCMCMHMHAASMHTYVCASY